MTCDDAEFDRDPQRVMREIIADPPNEHLLFHPQHTFVTDAAGALLSDYVGRVEEMQKSYDEICSRIGIPTAALEKVIASKRNEYREYYNQELIDGVAKLYARDLELFDYEF